MNKALIVVDMQNDFITGALRNEEGIKIVPAVKEFITNFDGDVFYTQDTHHDDYLETQEGRNLPVTHCIEDTEGWEIVPELTENEKPVKARQTVKKGSFGSLDLVNVLKSSSDYDEIHFVGVCTDICVISNAMIVKAAFPEAKLIVHKDLCAGVTPKSHETALLAMSACQIGIE